MSEAEPPDVGARLRALRKQRSLSLRALAAACGLSANTISLVEREMSSPSVATLHRLAIALGVHIAFFFEEESKETRLIFTQTARRPRVRGAGVTMESLGSGLSGQTIEPLRIILEPGADSGAQPVVHLGHELVYCLEGEIEYEVDGERYLMQPGDSLLFEAPLPHRWRNPGISPASVLLVLYASEGRQTSVQQHL